MRLENGKVQQRLIILLVVLTMTMTLLTAAVPVWAGTCGGHGYLMWSAVAVGLGAAALFGCVPCAAGALLFSAGATVVSTFGGTCADGTGGVSGF